MVDLDCANCGAKMEEGIKKIKGVQDASISFMAQKITIEAEEACKVCQKVDEECTIEY